MNFAHGTIDVQARIARRAAQFRISISPEPLATLSSYYALLMRWNRKLNLTAFRDEDSALDRLVLEPVRASHYLPPQGRLLDIGSGGGSPAIPVKVMLAGLHLTMVETRSRKAAFLREAVRQLGLTRTNVEQRRYEDLLGRPDLQAAYDVVTIRAVRVDPTVLRSLRPLLTNTGWIMLFHGAERPDWPQGDSLAVSLLPTGSSELTVVPALCLEDVPRGTSADV